MDSAKVNFYMDNIEYQVSSAIGLHSQSYPINWVYRRKKTQFQKPLAIETKRVSEDESVNPT